MMTRLLLAILTALAGSSAYAQSADVDVDANADMQADSEMPSDSQSGTSSGATAAETLRAPSPGLQDPNRRGFFQIGLGPAVSLGLDSDNVMYNVFGAYHRTYGPNWTGKIIGDAYLSAGGDSARVLNLGVGGNYAFTNVQFGQALPYASATVGVASARNDAEDTEVAPTASLGGGLKFMAANLIWDVNLHYTLITNQIDDTLPSVFGLRAGVNF